MTVTVIATGFDGMNGEKSKKPSVSLDMDLDDDFLDASSNSTGSRPRSSEPKVDPAVIDDDDTFTDIMSIFNRK